MARTRRRFTASVIFVSVMALVGAACGNGDDGGGGGGGDAGEESDVIRFTFAPDPAWDWVKDQGILEAMEQEYQRRREAAAAKASPA